MILTIHSSHEMVLTPSGSRECKKCWVDEDHGLPELAKACEGNIFPKKARGKLAPSPCGNWAGPNRKCSGDNRKSDSHHPLCSKYYPISGD